MCLVRTKHKSHGMSIKTDFRDHFQGLFLVSIWVKVGRKTSSSLNSVMDYSGKVGESCDSGMICAEKVQCIPPGNERSNYDACEETRCYWITSRKFESNGHNRGRCNLPKKRGRVHRKSGRRGAIRDPSPTEVLWCEVMLGTHIFTN